VCYIPVTLSFDDAEESEFRLYRLTHRPATWWSLLLWTPPVSIMTCQWLRKSARYPLTCTLEKVRITRLEVG
jgi:hypothetical protein